MSRQLVPAPANTASAPAAAMRPHSCARLRSARAPPRSTAIGHFTSSSGRSATEASRPSLRFLMMADRASCGGDARRRPDRWRVARTNASPRGSRRVSPRRATTSSSWTMLEAARIRAAGQVGHGPRWPSSLYFRLLTGTLCPCGVLSKLSRPWANVCSPQESLRPSSPPGAVLRPGATAPPPGDMRHWRS